MENNNSCSTKQESSGFSPKSFNWQNTIYARLLTNGYFALRGPTFNKKDEIKEYGGEWSGQYWIIPESAIKKIGAIREYQIKIAAHCHEKENIVWGNEIEVKQGWKIMGCELCHKSRYLGDKVLILQVFDDL